MVIQPEKDNELIEFAELAPPIGPFKMKPMTKEEERVVEEKIRKGEWIEDEDLINDPAFAAWENFDFDDDNDE